MTFKIQFLLKVSMKM